MVYKGGNIIFMDGSNLELNKEMANEVRVLVESGRTTGSSIWNFNDVTIFTQHIKAIEWKI